MYKKTVLENGLRIVSHYMPQRRTVALGLWIGVGGRYENKNNKGIAHFLEHVVFKGSKNYSNKAIKESIEGVGGSLNGFTSEELTCYFTKIPSQYLDLSLKIISDIALNPLLKTPDIEKERGVIEEEIRMYQDLPQHLVMESLDRIMWPNHPLGMDISGTLGSIGKITRQQIADFKESYYLAPNIVIAVCGDLKHEKLVALSKKIFSRADLKEDFDFKKVDTLQDKPQLELISKDTQQMHLAIGLHGLKRDDPDKHVLGILNVILGANMSSRLFNEVREEKGLAYEISSYVKRFYDTGAFIIHAGTDDKKLIQAIEIVLKELTKIKKEKVKEIELKRAKEYYIGQLIMGLEDTLDHMSWIGESTITMNKTYTFGQILEEVKKINADDLLRIANALFRDDKINLSVVGPSVAKAEGKIKDIFHLD